MEILSRSSVRTISLYDLGTTTLQGSTVPESVVQTLGVKRDKGMSSDQDAIHEREGLAWQEQSYLSVFLIGQGP